MTMVRQNTAIAAFPAVDKVIALCRTILDMVAQLVMSSLPKPQ